MFPSSAGFPTSDPSDHGLLRLSLDNSACGFRAICHNPEQPSSKTDTRKDGLGVPLVAVGARDEQGGPGELRLPRIYYGVTAVIRCSGSVPCRPTSEPRGLASVRPHLWDPDT
jgi:hypothetical protein